MRQSENAVYSRAKNLLMKHDVEMSVINCLYLVVRTKLQNIAYEYEEESETR